MTSKQPTSKQPPIEDFNDLTYVLEGRYIRQELTQSQLRRGLKAAYQLGIIEGYQQAAIVLDRVMKAEGKQT